LILLVFLLQTFFFENPTDLVPVLVAGPFGPSGLAIHSSPPKILIVGFSHFFSDHSWETACHPGGTTPPLMSILAPDGLAEVTVKHQLIIFKRKDVFLMNPFSKHLISIFTIIKILN
jgi:hypothetical protein